MSGRPKGAELVLDCALELGSLRLDVSWRCRPTMTALVGPSGAGKSTLIKVIAGLIRPDSGTVRWRERVLDDVGAGVHVKPHRRALGVVFQESRLFPHLSVEENLRFSPRARGGAIQVGEVVDALGLGDLLHRRPGALSGGERQRVALGRCLLSDPGLLLLDEPVSSLDLPTRLRFMRYLQAVHRRFEIPAVFVTHEPELVLHFAFETAVMLDGAIARSGPTRQVLATDMTGFGGARTNLVLGVVSDRGGETGLAVVEVAGREVCVPSADLQAGDEVWLRILTTDLLLMRGMPEALSARNVLAGEVKEILPEGQRVVIVVEAGPRWYVHVVSSTVGDLGLAPGASISVVAKATSFEVIPVMGRETGNTSQKHAS